MALLDLIRPDIIKVPLLSQNKNDVIRELIQILIDTGKVSDMERINNALLDREALGSTGLEHGIAVPHAKIDMLKELHVSIGISHTGIDFQALDGKPSYLFFLLLAPPGQSGPHIEALADIARITRSQAFYGALINATSAQGVVDLFNEG
jgi:fructose-specific phosphotransferase system IIA component